MDICPVCGNKTRDRIREDTVLKNYPIYCPKCNDINALKSILGASYPVDISDAELYLKSPDNHHSIEDYQTTMYDSIEELLIQEMIEQELSLSDRDLHHLADIYIPLIMMS